mmetsp:Transcript_61389/g.147758  ORF Transcript_61389/g.147758 Transcript_61389/m.147758 type:complete len:231 (+) Transcript_61389:256-948(+)
MMGAPGSVLRGAAMMLSHLSSNVRLSPSYTLVMLPSLPPPATSAPPCTSWLTITPAKTLFRFLGKGMWSLSTILDSLLAPPSPFFPDRSSQNLRYCRLPCTSNTVAASASTSFFANTEAAILRGPLAILPFDRSIAALTRSLACPFCRARILIERIWSRATPTCMQMRRKVSSSSPLPKPLAGVSLEECLKTLSTPLISPFLSLAGPIKHATRFLSPGGLPRSDAASKTG